MSYDPNRITVFAKTDARGQNVPFGIKAQDRTRHMYVIGKTGMGKSTLLENMAVQDIQNGEGMAFIDPHGQTAETLLDYIPESRKDDVLYFAPFDTNHPVAFNVMEDVGPDKRHLVVSGLMSVFKKIWIDAWSARMEYILQNTLLALLEYPDSTLLGVNRMLSEKNYRRKVIDNISDPAVKSFWVDEFLNYNERYMQEAGDAIKNKIGQFTANPLIRNIIGQPKSSFDIRKIMDEKKIIIMNLSKGLVGESNANLLGSMLTTRIYLAAMSRADLSQMAMKEAPPFYFYVDEFQSFANATFADILSEARKYKLNLTIAHQYIEQMEEEVKNAVFGNVGTIISFRVGPFDAEVLETIFAPKFYAVDICNLGFAQVYLTLMIDGIGSAPFSAVTLPPIEQHGLSCKDMVIHSSRQQFAKPRAAVEQSIVDWISTDASTNTNTNKQNNSPKNNNQTPPKDNNHQKNANGYRNNSQPKKDFNNPPPKNPPANNSRQQNQNPVDKKPVEVNDKPIVNNKSAAPEKNQKQVEELRAVLANLTKKASAAEPKQEPVPLVQKTALTSAKRDDDVKKEDAGIELKAALSRAIGENTNSTKAEVTSDKNQTSGSIKAEEQKTIAEEAKSVTTEKAKDKVSSLPPKPTAEIENKPTTAPAETDKDPFDPKVLERMMRLRSGDKTPFK